MEHERIELLLKKAKDEQDGKGSKMSLKETLTEQIVEQEELAVALTKEAELMKNDKSNGEKQHTMWADLNTLLNVKINCLREAKQAGSGGTLFVNKGAETFTLQ